MKRHLAPALFSLSLCAVMGGVRTAGAQTADGAAAQIADSASVMTIAPAITLAFNAAAPAPTASSRPASGSTFVVSPVILATTGVRPRELAVGTATAAFPTPVPRVDWKMPTSRALMIGGAATAVIGLAAIGGDTGAIIAMSGTAVAVYGLYLHYNR